jgi:hypothetical protein
MYLPLLAAVISAVLLLIVTAPGMGISPDSVVYIQTAQNISDGHGITSFNYTDGGRSPLTVFPPLLPAVLSVFALFGADTTAGIRIVNTVALGSVVFLACHWLNRSVFSQVLKVLGCLLIVLSVPLLSVFSWVWSEGLFILESVICLLALQAFTRAPSAKLAGTVGVSAGLAFLTRYAGTALMMSAFLVLVTAYVRNRTTPRYLGLFMLIAVLPTAALLLRNHFESGTFMGGRVPSGTSLFDNAYDTLRTLVSWILPFTTVKWVGAALIYCLFVTAALWLSGARRAVSPIRAALTATWPFLLFCLVYVVYLVASSSLFAIDPIGTRLASPLFIPLALSGVLLSDRLVSSLHGNSYVTRGTSALITAGLFLIVAASVYKVGRYVDNYWEAGGAGYNTKEWRASETVKFARNIEGPTLIFTNNSSALWFWTHRQVHGSPERHPYNSPNQPGDSIADFAEQLPASTGGLLVWFSSGRDWYYKPEELATSLNLELISWFSDGAVYRISP